MFKKIVKTLGFVFSLAFLSNIGRAQELAYPSYGGYGLYANYFKASLGASSLKDYKDFSGDLVFEENSIVPIQIGYGATMGNVAFEGEFGFNNNRYTFEAVDPLESLEGNLSSTNLMFNGYYKFKPNGTNFYLGGGLGFLSASMDGLEDKMSGSSLAVQVMAGLELKLNEKAGLFLEYKHMKSIGLELENEFTYIDFDYKQTSFNLGLKYYF